MKLKILSDRQAATENVAKIANAFVSGRFCIACRRRDVPSFEGSSHTNAGEKQKALYVQVERIRRTDTSLRKVQNIGHWGTILHLHRRRRYKYGA